MAPRVRARDALLVERADPVQELELVAQVRPHHLRPVRRDRERDLVLDEPVERLADGVLVSEGRSALCAGRLKVIVIDMTVAAA